MYHSQNNEAEVVINYFNGYVGALLDIGANNSVELSNSYDLIALGWKGHLVEPSDAYHAIQNTPYKYHYAVSNKSGIVDFYDCADTLLSTTNEWLAGAQNPNVSMTKVQSITFTELMHIVNEPKLDFITIDAEGCDWDILQQINLSALGVNACVSNREIVQQIIDALNSIAHITDWSANYCITLRM